MGRGLVSTRDQITERLREDVFSGRLPPGERVSEAALAEQFGVSRGPIREALSQLTSEGLFIAKQNCGVTVAPPAPETVRELVLPIRRTIEVYAFRQIFDSLNADDFYYWEEVLFRMDRACREGQWQRLAPLDVAFHRHILERAAQPDLLAIWQTIVTRLRVHFVATVLEHDKRSNLSYVHTHHAELVAAFRKGNKHEAIKALEAHIDEN